MKCYAKWKKEGFSTEQDATKKSDTEYRMDMDSVGAFVLECLDIDATQTWRLNNTQLYNTYIKWCNKNNERVMSQKWLTMRMNEKGFKKMVGDTASFWLGLAIKPQWMK